MTTLFLATIGGHLDQLDALARRMQGTGPAVWVTQENYQSVHLLRGRDAEFVPPVREGSVPDELIELVRLPRRTSEQEARLTTVKLDMADRVMASAPADVYDEVDAWPISDPPA